jgi:hypothetical protein
MSANISPDKAVVTVFQCSTLGISGTTPVHVRREGDRYEARVGVALMGATNMDTAGFEACGHDPFHDRFYDNYAHGFGSTEQEAIDAMKKDAAEIAATLWL